MENIVWIMVYVGRKSSYVEIVSPIAARKEPLAKILHFNLCN